MVSLMVLGILAICIAVTAHGVQRVHQVLAARQMCIAAAQAQIESIGAMGVAIEPNRLATLWPAVETQIQVIPDQGQWQGLMLVRATASVRLGQVTWPGTWLAPGGQGRWHLGIDRASLWWRYWQ
jgi:hypothetical protein